METQSSVSKSTQCKLNELIKLRRETILHLRLSGLNESLYTIFDKCRTSSCVLTSVIDLRFGRKGHR